MRRPLAPMVAFLILLGPTAASPGLADDRPGEDVLKAKDLRRAGTVYVLPGEASFQKGIGEARALYGQMAGAIGQQQMHQQQGRDAKGAIRELTEQRITINQQLAQGLPADQHNQLVAMVNGVTDRLNLLVQQENDPEAGRRADAQAARLREAYVQKVLDLRQAVDATTAAYAALAADPEVKAAIEKVGAVGKVRPTLGPSRGFLANLKTLEKAEAAVLTETVSLRKEGGIFWVDVTFNGKVTKSMAFDTGAADVVLPADFAAEIGLRPGPDTPTVRARVADGSVVEAKTMTVPSMRVGKFTVKDVACTIMPADKTNVPPLLGQTFQRNFLLKFSPDAGKLTLSRVETPDAPRPGPKPKAATKPAGKRAKGAASESAPEKGEGP